MKNLVKHIFVFLFSLLFIWIGSGENYVIYHFFNCQAERMEGQLHDFCSDEDFNHHRHLDGHCVYVIEYKLDIQKNVYVISIPSVDLFKSELFSLFISQKNENKFNRYTSFILPPRSANAFLSEICVFLI